MLSLEGRKNFIVDILKIGVWIVSQVEPIARFHLTTGVRLGTRNRHHITLQRDGILKEFSADRISNISMDSIKAVYDSRLPNVEQGHTNCTSITITSIGRRLSDAIAARIVTKEQVLLSVGQAVDQLHSIGIAHCDICTDNVFVDLQNNTVFLGDLEYCRPLHETPPIGIARGDSTAATARELDLIQLRHLSDELARL